MIPRLVEPGRFKNLSYQNLDLKCNFFKKYNQYNLGKELYNSHQVGGNQIPVAVSVCGTPNPELGLSGLCKGTGCHVKVPGRGHCNT